MVITKGAEGFEVRVSAATVYEFATLAQAKAFYMTRYAVKKAAPAAPARVALPVVAAAAAPSPFAGVCGYCGIQKCNDGCCCGC